MVKTEAGIYIHIPFCTSKCNYCDFYLITNKILLNDFLRSLEREIILSSKQLEDRHFDTIFLGGGTPSLLSGEQLDSIIKTLKSNINIDKNPEITIESNPEDFYDNIEKLYMFKEAGINRISLGVQSLNDSELKFLSRKHDSKQALIALVNVLEIFDNVSTDLIYSFPGQTNHSLRNTLDIINDYKVPHISAYTLMFEKYTLLNKQYLTGRINKMNDAEEANMYKYLSEFLISKGYIHYEISNYSKIGYESKHNLKYWECNDYIGLGPSAHSLLDDFRWNNFPNIIKYNQAISKNTLPKENIYKLSPREKCNDYIMCSLRAGGIDPNRIVRSFEIDFLNDKQEIIEQLSDSGLIDEINGRLRLSEKGFIIADEIILKLMF